VSDRAEHPKLRMPFAETLGIRYVSIEPDRVVGEMEVRTEFCTTPAVLHGGAMMAFADTLGAQATVVNLPEGKSTTTLESKTNFFAPATIGSKIIGECIPLHRGRRTMVWQTRITSPEGQLLAMVTQTQMVLDAGGATNRNPFGR